MKKIGLLIIAFVMTVAVRAQQVGSAGRLLQNEYQPNKQSRAVIGRGGVTINIDYRWEADYNRGIYTYSRTRTLYGEHWRPRNNKCQWYVSLF